MKNTSLNMTELHKSVKQSDHLPAHQNSDTPYVPTPIDTKDVVLTTDILELCELLAKNTHEVWSKNRIKEFAIARLRPVRR